MKKYLSLVAVMFIVSACAKPVTVSPTVQSEEVEALQLEQRTAAFKKVRANEQKIQDITYPVLMANLELCEDRRYDFGMSVWSVDTVDKQYRRVGEEVFGLTEDLRVNHVFKGSAAKNAGIKPGDVLVAINEEYISAGPEGLKQAVKIVKADEDANILLSFDRKGEEINLDLERDEVCNYDAFYMPYEQKVNAFADGQNIYITKGMMDFVRSDDELALVVSHEIAHNAMGHIDKQKRNSYLGGAGGLVFDILFAAAGVNTQGAFANSAANAGALKYSIEFEKEADYVGMYLMQRAGYKTSNVSDFWRRMGEDVNIKTQEGRSTHPGSPERFIAIDKTHKEIQAKLKKKEPLMPEMLAGAESERRIRVKSEPRGFN